MEEIDFAILLDEVTVSLSGLQVLNVKHPLFSFFIYLRRECLLSDCALSIISVLNLQSII